VAGYGPWFDPTAPLFGASTASTNNNAAIAATMAAAVTAGGGIVLFPDGVFKVVSSARTDAVTYGGGGSLTVTDASCVAGDVGSYCLGVGINGKEPIILTVNPGVSFTVDVAPIGVPTSLTLVKPAIVLPPRVTIVGAGSSAGNTVNWNSGAPSSQILDTGTGVTCLVRGSVSGTYVFPYSMQDIAIIGQNTNLYGLYMGNFTAFLTAERCHFGHHGVAGVAMDANVNSNNFTDCRFFTNGTVGATIITGGVLLHPYWVQASAACNFFTCFFDDNYGFGITDGGVGAVGVNLYGCQFNTTRATAYVGGGAFAPSGTAANLRTDSFGNAAVYGGWSETAATYDVWAIGNVLLSGFRMNSSTAKAIHVGTLGCATLISCYSSGHTTMVEFGSSGNISWHGCTCTDGSTGITGVSVAQMNGMGTTLGGMLLAGGPFVGVMSTDAFSGAITITVDSTKGNTHKINCTSNTASTLTPSAAGVAGQWLWLIITADVTGGNVITFASTFRPNGTLTTTASKAAIVGFVSDGTNWFEMSRIAAV